MLAPTRELFCSFILIISLVKTFSVPFPVLDNLKTTIVAELDTSKIRNYIDNVVESMTSNLAAKLLQHIQGRVDKVEDAIKKVYTKLDEIDRKLTTEPKECMDVAASHDGVYTIYPNGKDPLKVYCIIDGNKKWTVIQRRFDGSVRFNRTWSEYKIGFGSVTGEHWLGNDNIHLISSNGHHEIRFYIEASAYNFGYANYKTFSVGDEKTKYVLTIAGYSGNTSDSMVAGHDLNGQKFSTPDRDNDSSFDNCAIRYSSGWWYNDCTFANPNTPHSIQWYPYSLAARTSIVMICKAV